MASTKPFQGSQGFQKKDLQSRLATASLLIKNKMSVEEKTTAYYCSGTKG